MFKAGLVLSAVLFASGCAMTPYEDLNLDTTSNFRTPSEGKSGIYVYQWKTGVLGAIADVDFQIKGEPTLSLNTGEYGYFELAPGDYEYKLNGGLIDQYIPVSFEAGENYFFRAALVNFSDVAYLVRGQEEIEAAKKNIASGRYELHDKD